MTSKLLLRIAAILVLVHLLGHTFGHIMWDKPEDPKMLEVVNNMKSYKAEFMGATKSMADYYTGYSIIIWFMYAMTVFVLWFGSGSIAGNRPVISKLLMPFALCYLVFGVAEFLYFFPFAASMSFLAGLLSILAITLVKK